MAIIGGPRPSRSGPNLGVLLAEAVKSSPYYEEAKNERIEARKLKGYEEEDKRIEDVYGKGKKLASHEPELRKLEMADLLRRGGKSKEEEESEKNNLEIVRYLAKERNLELTPEQEKAAAKNLPIFEKSTKPVKEPKRTQASLPIDPEQLEAIAKVESNLEWESASIPQKNRMLQKSGVSKENSKSVIDPLIEQEKLKKEQEKIETKGKLSEESKIQRSWDYHKDYIKDVTNKYKSFETETKPKLKAMQELVSNEELMTPTAAQFSESLGIPLSVLGNPASELYQKLSLDLLKGLPESYGNRILKVEVDNFLNTIPTLANSAEGRRMVASSLLKLGEMKKVFFEQMRNQEKYSLENNKPLPLDFEERIFENAEPQINKINDEFIKLSSITAVPPDHIPFFDPSGNVVFVTKENFEWAMNQPGAKRIW